MTRDDPPRPTDPAAELRQLAQLVARMRDAQKRWFKGDKSSATLELSKSLERQADKALAAVLDDSPKLFD